MSQSEYISALLADVPGLLGIMPMQSRPSTVIVSVDVEEGRYLALAYRVDPESSIPSQARRMFDTHGGQIVVVLVGGEGQDAVWEVSDSLADGHTDVFAVVAAASLDAGTPWIDNLGTVGVVDDPHTSVSALNLLAERGIPLRSPEQWAESYAFTESVPLRLDSPLPDKRILSSWSAGQPAAELGYSSDTELILAATTSTIEQVRDDFDLAVLAAAAGGFSGHLVAALGDALRATDDTEARSSLVHLLAACLASEGLSLRLPALEMLDDVPPSAVKIIDTLQRLSPEQVQGHLRTMLGVS